MFCAGDVAGGVDACQVSVCLHKKSDTTEFEHTNSLGGMQPIQSVDFNRGIQTGTNPMCHQPEVMESVLCMCPCVVPLPPGGLWGSPVLPD